MLDFYHYEERLQRKLKEIRNTKDINNHNKTKIIEFQKSCQAQSLSSARILRYFHDLPEIAKKLRKNFEDVERSDIEKIIAEAEAVDLASVTKLSHGVTLKKFYKWMNGGEEYPSCVKRLRTTGRINKENLPDDLLTEEEIKKLIEASTNPCDRALIST